MALEAVNSLRFLVHTGYMNIGRNSLHPAVWSTWIICCAATLLIFSNPIYDIFVIVLCFAISATFAYSRQRYRMFCFVMLMIAIFSLFRIVLMLLTTHGTGHVFFHLPSVVVPRFIGGYQLGGSLELTVLLQTLTESLLLAAIVACFALGGVVVAPADWLNVVPRVFFTPTLAILIGVGAIPNLLSSARAAREADLARTGGTLKGGAFRRWQRLLMPIVDDALEHSVGLGESLETRGFGTNADDRKQWFLSMYLIIASAVLVALLVGWNTIAFLPRLLLLTSITFLAILIAISSRQGHRTLYRKRRLELGEKVLIAFTSVCLLFAFLISKFASSVSWQPSTFERPHFVLLATLVVLLFSWPLLRLKGVQAWT